WGAFVGTHPTAAHYAVTAEFPITHEVGEPFDSLRAAGFKALTLAFDLSSAWSEQTRTATLRPATFRLDRLFSASLAVPLGIVRAALMAGDMVGDAAKLAPAVAAVEAGPLELSFHDAGGLDLVVAQFAKTHGVNAADARTMMIDQLNVTAAALPQ